MVAERAGDEDAVSWLGRGDRHRRATLRVDADARRRDEDLVALAAVDHLGVAGDERDVRFRARASHRGDDLLELRDLEPLLEDEGRREEARNRAPHGEVVHRPVHGEAADVAAGEEERAHDERVGGEGDARAGADVERRLVFERGEDVVREGGEKDVLEELGREATAAPVTQHDALVTRRGDGAGAEGGLGGIGGEASALITPLRARAGGAGPRRARGGGRRRSTRRRRLRRRPSSRPAENRACRRGRTLGSRAGSSGP